MVRLRFWSSLCEVAVSDQAVLVLKLAGPLQSWGSQSRFNQRHTDRQPTKSGVIGLLAAAQGLRRGEDLADLRSLSMGVRVDQPGQVLRDYHVASDYRGQKLLSSVVNAKGRQKPTGPAKMTAVTQRFYLQDAVFVVALAGDEGLLSVLADAVQAPVFPLALGRRSCVPQQPMVLPHSETSVLWPGQDVSQILRQVVWQASERIQDERIKKCNKAEQPFYVKLATTVDAPQGDDTVTDVPVCFDPHRRGMTSRQVSHDWVVLGDEPEVPSRDSGHNPFEILG